LKNFILFWISIKLVIIDIQKRKTTKQAETILTSSSSDILDTLLQWKVHSTEVFEDVSGFLLLQMHYILFSMPHADIISQNEVSSLGEKRYIPFNWMWMQQQIHWDLENFKSSIMRQTKEINEWNCITPRDLFRFNQIILGSFCLSEFLSHKYTRVDGN
jgi:hypothetical protein